MIDFASLGFRLVLRRLPALLPTLAITGGLVLAAVGCSGDESPRAASPSDRKDVATTAAPKATEETRPPTPEDAVQAVGQVMLTADDVGSDAVEQDSDDSLDAVTNDICAQQWPSNDERTARRQSFYWADVDVAETVVSSEAVAYQEGQARAALQEIADAVAECGGWKHKQGELTGVAETEPPDGALDDSFAWGATDERSSQTYSYLAVYQVSGDLLSGLYVWAPSTDEALEVARDLVPKAAQRLDDSADG